MNSIDTQPGLTDADKVRLKFDAQNVLQKLQSSNSAAITTNKQSFQGLMDLSAKGTPPPIQAWKDIQDRAVYLGDPDTAHAAATEIANHHWVGPMAQLSPSQQDRANGVGRPVPAVGPPLTGLDLPRLSGDLSGQSTFVNKGQPIQVQGFIVHHTGGHGTPQDVVATLNARGLGVQYIMDRQGNIFSALPEGTRGAHLQPANNGSGLSNANTLGMEIIAKDAADVTPQQQGAAAAFIAGKAAQYGFPLSNIYGHGEVNRGHKEPDEGLAVAQLVRGGPGGDRMEAAIRAGATAAGVDPNILVGIYRGEGKAGYIGDNGSSFGPFQLHMGGLAGGKLAGPGMGDDFKRERGLDPSTVPQQIAWVAQKLKENPGLISQFHGYQGPATGGAAAGGVTWADLHSNPGLAPTYIKSLAGEHETRTRLAGGLIDSSVRALNNNIPLPPETMTQIEQLASPEARASSPTLAQKYDEYARTVEASRLATGGQAAIDQARANAAAQPDLFQRQIVERAQELRDSAARQLRGNPVAYATNRGLIKSPPPPLDGNIQTIPAHFAGNAAIVDAIGASEPGVSKSVVFPNEVQNFGAAMAGPHEVGGAILTALSNLPQDKRAATLGVPEVKTAILGMAASSNEQKKQYAFDFMGRVYREDPQTFERTFGVTGLSQLMDWQDRAQFLSPKEIADEAKTARDASEKRAIEAWETKAKDLTKNVTAGELASKLSGQSWLGSLFSDKTPVGGAADAFVDDYRHAYAFQLGATHGNEASAERFAMARLGVKWSASNANGGRIMPWAPEAAKGYPEVNGGKDYIATQLADAVHSMIMQNEQRPVEQRAMFRESYALIPDQQTAAEYNDHKPTSYQVAVTDKDGRLNILSHPGPDGIPMPFRWSADPAAAKAQAESEFTARREQSWQPPVPVTGAL